MSWNLSEAEVRVLGSLVEKEMATPEYYPMSLNALVNACNQKSNREPVVSYDEGTVARSLESLRGRGLALVTTGVEHRVPKHSHRVGEKLNLGNRELAVLCELMVRGPQTLGELKSHAQRLHHFDDLEAVQSTLERLMEWEPEPLAARMAPQPGRREVRYAHLLSGEPVESLREPAPAAPVWADPLSERVTKIEGELLGVREELRRLREQVEDFISKFE